MNTGTPPGEDAMSAAALPAEIIDPESADPSEPGPSTRLAPPPEETHPAPGPPRAAGAAARGERPRAGRPARRRRRPPARELATRQRLRLEARRPASTR